MQDSCRCSHPLPARVYRAHGPRHWCCRQCDLLIIERKKPAPPPALDEARVYAIVYEMVAERPSMSTTAIRTKVSREHGTLLISDRRMTYVIGRVRDELGVVTTQGKVWA